MIRSFLQKFASDEENKIAEKNRANRDNSPLYECDCDRMIGDFSTTSRAVPVDMVLVTEEAYTPFTHGGPQNWRVRTIWMNGVLMEKLTEGGADTDYATGRDYDRFLSKRCAKYALALGADCFRNVDRKDLALGDLPL